MNDLEKNKKFEDFSFEKEGDDMMEWSHEGWITNLNKDTKLYRQIQAEGLNDMIWKEHKFEDLNVKLAEKLEEKKNGRMSPHMGRQ